MKVLDLVLKTKWYDMIERGEKPFEYRAESPYWIKRLTYLNTDFIPFSYRNGYEPIPFKEYTHVRFHRAYTKTTMLLKLNGMDYGFGNSALGAPDEEVFILELGKRIGN